MEIYQITTSLVRSNAAPRIQYMIEKTRKENGDSRKLFLYAYSKQFLNKNLFIIIIINVICMKMQADKR